MKNFSNQQILFNKQGFPLRWLWSLLFALLPLLGMAQTIRYVKASASGANNGTSWANAYTDLQDAMNAAAVGDEIWVAAGTYKPSQYPTGITPMSLRDKAFYLNKNIKIYGGFVGTEAMLSLRNHAINATILSGDIGIADNSSDNCYNVFITANLTAAAFIDGVTIRDGNASSIVPFSYSGYTFGRVYGGGIFNLSSSPTLENVVVKKNIALQNGGGIYNLSSSPTLTNVTVAENVAEWGGGMYNSSSSPILTNVIFMGNTATNHGGGICNSASSPTLTNVTVAENSATNQGAGIYNDASSPNVRNSIIWANAVYRNGGSPSYVNSLVAGSGGSSAWNSSYGTNGGNNLDINPLFVSSTDCSLQSISPAINAGNNTYNTSTTDLAGKARIQESTIDMGAYEKQAVILPIEMLYFIGNIHENGNLLIWATVTEKDNLGFEIEKSFDGKTFEKIGFVKGNRTKQRYEFLDENSSTVLTYYRLKQLDFNGRFEYSKVISLVNENLAAKMRLYPNPTTGNVQMTIQQSLPNNTTLRIYDILGRNVKTVFLQQDNTHITIDISDLANGVYQFHFANEYKKVVKQ